MNAEQNTEAVLFALFQLSRENRHISAATLAAAANSTPTVAACALVALEHAGLVDASRARLTMPGLMAAAQLEASSSGGPALELRDLKAAQQTTATPSTEHRVPVAARSQQSADRRSRPVGEADGRMNGAAAL